VTPLFGGKKGGGEPSAGGRRSAAEREAARLERERRRAEREGRPLPPAPPAPQPAEPVYETPAEPVYEAPPEPVYEAPAEPVYEPPAPEPVYEAPAEPAYEPPAPEAVYEPPPVEPQYEVPFEPVYEPANEPVTVPPDDHGQYTDEYAPVEAPAGVRRVPAPSVADLPRVGGPRPAPPGPVRGPAGQRRAGRPRGVPRGRRFGRRVVAVLFLLVAVAAAYFAYRVFQPGHGDGDAKRPVTVVIPQGATASEIGDELERAGVVDSAFFFNVRSRLTGQRGDLKAGRFTLRRDMSYTAALDALTKNPAAAPTVTVTIPEGRSIGEAAPLIRQAGLSGSYVQAATRNPRTVTGLKGYGVPKGTRTLEGFLFPATYELKKGAGTATAKAVVAQQLAAFKANYDKLDRRAAKRKNLTDYDVLIIASMIEREAQVAKDRRLISAVIYNRLKQHIPLGIDATLRYRLNNWTKPLKQSELQTDSAFNTRTRQGLPPTPIGSPGLASIKAALNPAKVSYLYYVVKPNSGGAHAFSSTNEQFQKDVAAYNRARAANGGNAP
jgi:peptidoglycan lytic transglycosylase G